MRLWHVIRRQLSIKLFLSYLIVVILGIVVLSTAVEFTVPNAFARHMSAMATMMGRESDPMQTDLFNNFRQAVNESLAVATTAATLSAIVVSLFISRQVTGPIRAVRTASQHIADGHYHERVPLPNIQTPAEADELEQLALSFNQMAANLEQTEALRRQLIGDVAHELRTPLTTLKGTAEALLDGVLPPNAETFQGIYREADRMQRLVADLQELSRVEAGAYPLYRHPISIAKICSTVCERLARQFEEKGVAISTNIPALPNILGDEDRLTQVLTNLIGNALQYTPRGGQVTVTAHRVGGEIRVAVQDDGIGIPAEDLPHLFDRFYRVDKSRSRAGGGSGIGLTIAKHLVEAHGGQIWVESSGTGQGSMFTFSLPVSVD
ncbi:MAG: HAMP domain-containing protein [Anaerolineales bacterium]|nr:HAMP domain-containing protein [Anaerolineales bacterium]